MNYDEMFKGLAVAGNGLAAERVRLDTIARNIANANVVGAPGEEPYRRQEVVFETVLDAAGQPRVQVSEIAQDNVTPFNEVHDPSHPSADPKTGLVRFPNVNSVFEMVDLMTASRAYEANLKAMSTYRDMVRQSLKILEG